MRRMTAARLLRTISGSVNSVRLLKSSSENSRIHTPAETRPQRPERWRAAAWEIFFDMKLLHFCPRGIAFDTREAGVDDVFDARHGERGFGDVGRQHDAAFRAGGVEDFVLLGVRQACEQGQDFVVATQRGFAQGFGGFADFALAR